MISCLRDRNNRVLILAAAAVFSGAVLVTRSGCGGGTSGTGVGVQSFERVRGTVVTRQGEPVSDFPFLVAGSDTTVVTAADGSFETEVSCNGSVVSGSDGSAGDVSDGNVSNGAGSDASGTSDGSVVGGSTGDGSIDGAAPADAEINVIVTDPDPLVDPSIVGDPITQDPAGGEIPDQGGIDIGAPIPIEPGIGDGNPLPADGTVTAEATNVIVEVSEPLAAAVTEPGQDPDSPVSDTGLTVEVDFSEVCAAAAAAE